MKQIKGWNVVVLLSCISVLLWFLAPAVLPRFSSFSTVATSLGQVLGLIATVLFSINFFLSTRLPVVNKLFGGLVNAYQKHSLLGQIALVLALLHPLLLLSKYASSLPMIADFLWLGKDLPINFGIIGLWLMVLLVVLTLYVRPKYHIWKWSHKFFGVAFLLVSLHVWLIPSDISHFLPLRLYMLTLTSLGLLAWMYRSMLGSFLVKKYSYRVAEVTALSDTITEICLLPVSAEDQMLFTAGQFIFVKFISENVSNEEHPFSITSAPTDSQLCITVKVLGDYTSGIHTIQKNTVAEIEGPFGTFSFQQATHQRQIWIAGGIGITPFLSMLRSISAQTAETTRIDIYYCVKNEMEAVYSQQIQKLCATLPQGTVNYVLFCSESSGHLTVETIESSSAPIQETDIFICAPPPMVHSLKAQMVARGINPEYIHSEVFDL